MNNVKKFCVSGFFFLLACMSLILIIRVLHVDRDWTVGDWLINYQGGFVRRGLAGQCIFLVSRYMGWSPTVILGVTLFALQSALLFCWYRLALGTSLQAWVLAAIVSPATISFAMLDFWGGFRKELFLLAAFAGLVCLLRSTSVSDAVVSALISAILVIAVLSHEAALFFVPYFFAALVACGRSSRRALTVCIVPSFLALLAGVACFHHRGSEETADKICKSLGYSLNHVPSGEICAGGGATAYLSNSSVQAFQQTAETVRTHHVLSLYLGLSVLSLLPLLIGTKNMRKAASQPALKLCWIAAGVSFAGSILLFLFAIDWGRWIHMHVMLLSTVLLALDARLLGEPGATAEAVVAVSPLRRFTTAAALILYATGWMLPRVYYPQTILAYQDTARQLTATTGLHRSRVQLHPPK